MSIITVSSFTQSRQVLSDLTIVDAYYIYFKQDFEVMEKDNVVLVYLADTVNIDTFQLKVLETTTIPNKLLFIVFDTGKSRAIPIRIDLNNLCQLPEDKEFIIEFDKAIS